MKHALFIDPGLASDNGTGWAHFVEHNDVALVNACGLVQGVDGYPLPLKCRDIVGRVVKASGLQAVDLLVIEHMRVYPIARMKGDPNDLLELAYLEGSFQIIASDAVKLVPARDWKGQVPKNVMKPRIQRSLNERERTTVRDAIKGLNAKEAANVWDACGIGLHHYGRLR